MSKLFSLNVFKDKNSKKNSGTKQEENEENGGGDNNKTVRDGSTFDLQYLGSILLDELEEGKSYGNSISAEAVKTIVHMAKASGKKKLSKVSLTVSPTGITTVDTESHAVVTELDIHRIHFCTADKNHTKVFAYIARSTENETMECHAFLCPKWKVAKAVTLAVAQAFQAAKQQYEKEQEEAERKKYEAVFDRTVPAPAPVPDSPPEPTEAPTGILVNLDPEPENQPPAEPLGFEDNFEDQGFEDNFVDTFKPLSAVGRQNPFSASRFSMGLEEHDIDDCVRSMAQGHRQRLPSTGVDDLWTS